LAALNLALKEQVRVYLKFHAPKNIIESKNLLIERVGVLSLED